FADNSNYGKYTHQLFKEKRFSPTEGKKDAGDHPPITPLLSLEPQNSILKTKLQYKIYDLLSRHYLALFGKVAVEANSKLKLQIKKEPFHASLISLIDEGFFEIAPFLKRTYNPIVKIVSSELEVDKIDLNQKETKPPPHYTDTSLLKLMERHNLGTKATRPVIIQLLQDRRFIERINSSYYITELGKFIIDNLKQVWLPFLKPKFTRYVEEMLEKIKTNQKKMDEVVNSVRTLFLRLFDRFLAEKKNLIQKIKEMEDNHQLLVETKNSNQKEFPKTTALCPVCQKNPMILVSTKKGKRFLACSDRNCKSYLSVPKKGRIYILKSTCGKCGFNIFKINLRKNGKSYNYYICPRCWTEGLKNDQSIGFCSQCDEYKIIKNNCVKK
ncbi:MAG: hypothetical protein GF383_12960, partial [Candidatus Lokiarchaeota archaeon]|nr:hypothetical protein [Candidatus Lokiarchaeota archaeon]MBD3342017.1 hypothetical protein [Candidatus Lokiarchaeota archaeon]